MVPFTLARRAGVVWLVLAAACTTPAPTPTQTALAGPTASAAAGASATATTRAAATASGLAASGTAALTGTAGPTPVGTATLSTTLRAQAGTVTLTPGPAATLSATVQATGTAPAPLAPIIGPDNAGRVALAGSFGPNARLENLAWSPDGQRLAVAGALGVLVYDWVSGEVAQPITTSAWATSAAFSPDGLALAAGSVDAAVVVFDLETGEPRVVLVGPGVRVEQVRYLSAAVVASLGVDNAVHLWDVAGQVYLGGLGAAPGPAHSLAASPGGPSGQRWLAAAAGADVRLWTLTEPLTATVPVTATSSLTLTQPAPVGAIALSPDGRWLAASSATGTILVWDTTTGQAVKRLARLAGAAQRLAFSPDGQVLASAHPDRLIRLWSLPGGNNAVAALAGHTDLITGLAFSPDGRALASTGWDGRVRVWQAR